MPFTEAAPAAQPDVDARILPARPLRLLGLLALLILTLAASASAYRWLTNSARDEAENTLSNLNASQVQELDVWRRAQLAAARTIAYDPLLARTFLAAREGNVAARQDLALWAAGQRLAYGWTRISFIDLDQQPVPDLSWPANDSQSDLPGELITRILASGQPQLTPILSASPNPTETGALVIAAVAPLREPAPPRDSSRNPLIGAVLLGKDPRQALFPLLYKWSLQQFDAKSWLIATDGPAPRLLAGPPGDMMTEPNRATLSHDSLELHSDVFMRELTDLAGRRAFAVAARAPGSDWLVVTTAPVTRLMAPARQTLTILAMLLVLVLVSLSAAQRLLALRKERRDYQDRYQEERSRRQLAETLRERDSQLKIFFYHALTGIGIAREDLRWLRINPALATLIGSPQQALADAPCADLFAVEDRPAVLALFEQLRGGALDSAKKSLHLLQSDGASVPVRLALNAIRNPDQSLRYVLIQIEDLRDRQEADQLYQVLIESSLDGFWILGEDARLLEVNTGYCQMTGYSRVELIGQPVSRVEPEGIETTTGLAKPRRPDQRLDLANAFFETTHRHKDGSLLNVEVSASRGGPNNTRHYVFLRDITERTRIRRALEAERAQLRGLFDGLDAILYVADLDSYALLYANVGFRGPLDANAIGQPCYRVMHARESICPFCTNATLSRLPANTSHIWQLHDPGPDRWYRCADKVIRWSDGRQVRLQIATDITVQKKADQQALQLEKLSSLGQLTAGLAHELNNPLMGIINAVQFGLDPDIDGEERTQVLRDAEMETRRCIGIVRELLAFSRHQDAPAHSFRQIDPQPIIQRVLRLLKYLFEKENITLTIDLDPTLNALRLQPERFEQVLVNLLANAIDAVAGQPQRHIGVRLNRQDNAAILQVHDSGPGVPPDIQRRVFEPFFTTKPPGKGTGFGLSTSWSIVTEHGGTLEFSSADGEGARVTASFPLGPANNNQSEQSSATSIQSHYG